MHSRKLLPVLIMALVAISAVFTVQAGGSFPIVDYSCDGSSLKVTVSNYWLSTVTVTVNGSSFDFNSDGSHTFSGSGTYTYSATWDKNTFATGSKTCGGINLNPPHNDGRLFDSQDGNGDRIIPFCDTAKGVVLRWVTGKDANGTVTTVASGGWSFDDISNPGEADANGNSEVGAEQSKAGVGSARLYKLADGSLQLNITDAVTGKTVAHKIKCSKST